MNDVDYPNEIIEDKLSIVWLKDFFSMGMPTKLTETVVGSRGEWTSTIL